MQFCSKGMEFTLSTKSEFTESIFMEISHFGASIPQRSWHTSTWDAWYNWIFGKRVLSGTVEDNVLETTEGLRTKKHRTARSHKVQKRTTPYCKELLRTKYYAVPRSIYYYTLESTTQYSQVFLHTTKYYQCILHGKIQHFALRRSPRNLTKCCAYHEKCDSKIIKYYACHKK